MNPERSLTSLSLLTIASVLILSAGCAYTGTGRDFDPSELKRSSAWIAIEDVPVIRQESKEDCGAAALSMVLTYWKVPTSIEDVVKTCDVAPGTGIRAGELRDFARMKGMKAFLIQGELGDLERELSKGRPVLIGMVKPHSSGALTHYEVVVGLNPEKGLIVTIDPANGWRQNSLEDFLVEWEAAGRLTLVIL